MRETEERTEGERQARKERWRDKEMEKQGQNRKRTQLLILPLVAKTWYLVFLLVLRNSFSLLPDKQEQFCWAQSSLMCSSMEHRLDMILMMWVSSRTLRTHSL